MAGKWEFSKMGGISYSVLGDHPEGWLHGWMGGII